MATLVIEADDPEYDRSEHCAGVCLPIPVDDHTPHDIGHGVGIGLIVLPVVSVGFGLCAFQQETKARKPRSEAMRDFFGVA